MKRIPVLILTLALLLSLSACSPSADGPSADGPSSDASSADAPSVPPSPSVSAPTDPPGATASPGGATESDVREAIRQYNSAASAADQLKFLPFDFEKYQALLEGVAVLAGAGTSDWERLPPDGPPLPCDTITRMPDATAALMLRYYYDAIQTTADFGADVLLDIRKATDLFEASDASGASSSTWIVLDGTIYRLIL